MAKRRKKKQKAKELTKDKIIDIDTEREERRLRLRREAELSRAKRGEKSLVQEMFDEMTRGDEPQAAEKEKQEAAGKSGKNKKNAKKKRRSPQLKVAIAVIIVVLILLAFSIGNIINLKMQESEAKSRLEELSAEKEELEQQVSELGTDAYMEEQAREWLRMAKQGEIIYNIEDTGEDSQQDSR